jgi:hypothetical protein
MKNLMLAIALFSSVSAQAESNAELVANCRSIESMVSATIEARKVGVTVEELLLAVEDSSYNKIILHVYELPKMRLKNLPRDYFVRCLEIWND